MSEYYYVKGPNIQKTNEYIPGSMTDEQALETLKTVKITMGRGSAKTIFQQGLMEAICHAVKALEEKVEAKENE